MSWTEDDSDLYQEIAPVAVPARAEQMAALLTLIPAQETGACRIVELACGEGRFGEALLTAFPRATYLGLDGSAGMREMAGRRLERFGGRARAVSFELASTDWAHMADGADVVISSLAIHHLDAPGKRALFGAIAPRLSANGALLIADLIEPARPEAAALFAGGWDHAVAVAARGQANGEHRAAAFHAAQWNHYRHPDPMDRPSPLFDQLCWLRDAGFAIVDCFWMQAGHAIYGGYRAGSDRQFADRYAAMLAIAEQTCAA